MLSCHLWESWFRMSSFSWKLERSVHTGPIFPRAAAGQSWVVAASPIRGLCALVHQDSYLVCFSAHSTSCPPKAPKFENPVPTLRGVTVGGGGNPLIGSQTNGPSYPGCTTLWSNRSVMKTCLCISFRKKKKIKKKNCLEPFIMTISIIINIRSCLLRTL